MAHHETDIAHDGRRLAEGLLFLLLYCLLIAAAVYLTANVGADCAERGPCKVWLGPGVVSTSGAYAIGLLFVVRDFIQRRIGVAVSLCAVVMGAALSGVLIMQGFVLATTVALLVSGLVDLVIYTSLARRRFVTAVAVSSLTSAVVGSAIFLWLAFASFELLPGQIAAKALVILLAIPFTRWLFKRDRRIGLEPA